VHRRRSSRPASCSSAAPASIAYAACVGVAAFLQCGMERGGVEIDLGDVRGHPVEANHTALDRDWGVVEETQTFEDEYAHAAVDAEAVVLAGGRPTERRVSTPCAWSDSLLRGQGGEAPRRTGRLAELSGLRVPPAAGGRSEKPLLDEVVECAAHGHAADAELIAEDTFGVQSAAGGDPRRRDLGGEESTNLFVRRLRPSRLFGLPGPVVAFEAEARGTGVTYHVVCRVLPWFPTVCTDDQPPARSSPRPVGEGATGRRRRDGLVFHRRDGGGLRPALGRKPARCGRLRSAPVGVKDRTFRIVDSRQN
jgi:hypothetical protein